MNRTLAIFAFSSLFTTRLLVSAQEALPSTPTTSTAPAKSGLPVEQKAQLALNKELLKKYDLDKNGQLDKQELAAITNQEDKVNLPQARLAFKAKTSSIKSKTTDEQEALDKELVAKYDTNKDGYLDKTERAAITNEVDIQKMVKAGFYRFDHKFVNGDK